MKWEKWIKEQLRTYLFNEIDIERLVRELEDLDNDLAPKVTEFSHVPKGGNRRGSIIEYQVVKREKLRNQIESNIWFLRKKKELLDRAFNRLTEFHHKLISLLFFTLKDECEIAKEMNIPKWQLAAHRKSALMSLYDALFQEYNEERNKKKG